MSNHTGSVLVNNQSSNRIPSIDGLRAVSIGLVLVWHSGLRPGNVAPAFRPLVWVTMNGPLGVSIFFVISGFLITTLLLKEADETGGISLRDFYVRRACRILPACYAFLGTLLVLKGLGMVPISLKGWLSAVVFVRNYLVPVEGQDFHNAHCWSLSLEEQFYLLWPLGLILLGRRRAIWLAAGLIAAAPLSRVITYFVLPNKRPDIIYMTHTRVDTLMFGCLAALLSDSDAFRGALRRAFAFRLPLLAVFWVMVVSPLLWEAFYGRYLFTVRYTLEGLGIVLVLLWVVERPKSLVGRLLNSRPLVHLGILSYSIYLWQQLFIFKSFKFTLLPLLLVAECSYFLIERPFLRLRKRFLHRGRTSYPLAADPMPALRPAGVLLDEAPA
ncbi:MAG: acyltransferase [Planctomycetaceae bacterium]|nr:acyltransferase [Planctomycetaceae bacterium]